MYMYRSMYRAEMLYRNERLADIPVKSSTKCDFEVYGYDVFGVTAFYDFQIKSWEKTNMVRSESLSKLMPLNPSIIYTPAHPVHGRRGLETVPVHTGQPWTCQQYIIGLTVPTAGNSEFPVHLTCCMSLDCGGKAHAGTWRKP